MMRLRSRASARSTRWLSVCFCLLLALPPPLRAEPANRLTPEAQRALEALPPGQTLSVIVRLVHRAEWPGPERVAPARAVAARLRRQAEVSHAPLLAWLRAREAEGGVAALTPLWIINGFAASASRQVILELAARPEVARIALDQTVLAPYRSGLATSDEPVGDNLIAIGAPAAWARGVTGQGVVVAVLDSGVDLSHPELAARWRGGGNSWFDPNGEHPDEPFDVSGHGTQTLGVIAGGGDSGTRIGVAPDAQWIAAKIFDDRGRARTSGIHQALQWVLDPDGDPETDDAPQVVNSSWSFVNPGCRIEFVDDLRALRAAGILPVFAAGVSDAVSPADNPEAFGVGALAEDLQTLSLDSPHGPPACGDPAATFPDMVAPGTAIRTTDRFGLYAALDGTSLAAAHVSGALALLLSADPTLTADEQERILVETAVDLGDSGPDNQFGYGRLNIAAALDRLLGPDPARSAARPASPSQAAASDRRAPSIGLALAGGVIVLLIGAALMRRRRQAPKE